MSRRRGESSRIQEIDDNSSGEDESFYETQTELSNQEKIELAGKLCNFLLQNEERKIPAKPADMRKLVLKDQANHFMECMGVASEMMKDTYGYTIKQLSTKEFILIDESNLHDSLNPCDTFSFDSNMEVKGLLFLILSIIYMCDGRVEEGTLEKFLKHFKIHFNPSVSHEIFGNVSKLLQQDFIRQKYLKTEMRTRVDPPVRSYLWGERAFIEVSQKKVVEMVSKIYGERMKPEMFVRPWKNALKAEGGNQAGNTTQDLNGTQTGETSQQSLRTSQRRR